MQKIPIGPQTLEQKPQWPVEHPSTGRLVSNSLLSAGCHEEKRLDNSYKYWWCYPGGIMIEIIRFEYIFSDLAKELECIIFNGKFYDLFWTTTFFADKRTSHFKHEAGGSSLRWTSCYYFWSYLHFLPQRGLLSTFSSTQMTRKVNRQQDQILKGRISTSFFNAGPQTHNMEQGVQCEYFWNA